MEMVVESMEMAPGAIPHPSRVPKQRLLSPEIGLRWRQRCRTFLGKTPIDLGFSHRRLIIGEGVMSEGGQGPHSLGWHTKGNRTTRWCGHLLAPLRLFFGLCLVSGENRNFGLRFVQFREYFLCNFSETHNNRK
jgi:hypothetical protein